MKKNFLLCLYVIVISSCIYTDDSQIHLFTTDFVNPVFKSNAPDPTIIKTDKGKFYLYTTQANVLESEDLMNWTLLGRAFDGVPPQWLIGGTVWAPDINYIDGKYYLYYALSKWGEEIKNGIGVAISKSPKAHSLILVLCLQVRALEFRTQ